MKTSTSKAVVLTLLLLGTAGCVPWIVSRMLSVPEELDGLYDEIHASRLAYEDGIERIVSGDPVGGRRALDAATDRLYASARECETLEACEGDLFLRSLGEVLDERSYAVRGAGVSLGGDVEETGSEDDRALRGRDFEALIPFNDPVKAALNDWLTWKRPLLADTVDNYHFLRARLAPIYREAGLWTSMTETVSPIALVEEISLEELAICLGEARNPRGWFRTLRNLNPRLSPEDRLPPGTEIQLPDRLTGIYRRRCLGESPLRAWARTLHDPD
jgi:hypothetical protein